MVWLACEIQKEMVIVLRTLLGNACCKCVWVLKTLYNSPSVWFQDGSYLAEFLLAKGYEVGDPK